VREQAGWGDLVASPDPQKRPWMDESGAQADESPSQLTALASGKG
jgi:hypothetical protein